MIIQNVPDINPPIKLNTALNISVIYSSIEQSDFDNLMR